LLKLFLWLAAKFQHIGKELGLLGSGKNSEPIMEKPAFLRQEVDALAKLIDQSEDGRSKPIGLGKASPQSIHGGRFRQFQRRCDFFKRHSPISRALAHSATRFAAYFAEGFAYEDGGQMLSTKRFAAFPADFLAGEDRGARP